MQTVALCASIMETAAVVEIFQKVAQLPRLQKVTISFQSPLPVSALSELFHNNQGGRTTR